MFLFGISCSFRFRLLENLKNMLNSNWYRIKVCFMLVPVLRMVNLASVELIRELMQEIHKFDTGTSLKYIFTWCWLVLEAFLTFFCLLKAQGTNQHQIKIYFKLHPVFSMAFLICRSSVTLISHFLLILDHFQSAYLTLIIHILAKWQ